MNMSTIIESPKGNKAVIAPSLDGLWWDISINEDQLIKSIPKSESSILKVIKEIKKEL